MKIDAVYAAYRSFWHEDRVELWLGLDAIGIGVVQDILKHVPIVDHTVLHTANNFHVYENQAICFNFQDLE